MMDLWDKPFLAHTFQDLADLFKDGMVSVDTANTEETTSDAAIRPLLQMHH
jgi:hypothetical protein